MNGIPRAHGILARLLLDAGNLAAVKSALATGFLPSSPHPAGTRAILAAVIRRLENREWVLIEGPVRATKPSAPRRPEVEMVPVERADWRSTDEEPAEAREPALAIAVEHEIEPLALLECAFELEEEGGLETAYELEASAAPGAGGERSA